jgi:CDP-glycerol glycerophosphotransferase (TagB/SpsB family)
VDPAKRIGPRAASPPPFIIAGRDAASVNAFFVSLRVGLVRLAFAIGRRRPLQARVVLATAHADRIGGNLACLRDAMAARAAPLPVVVLTRSGGPRLVAAALDAMTAGYHLATARVVVVDDYFFPMYVVPKRLGTTFVQTWHACGAFKKFGYSILDKSFGADATAVERHPIHTNYDVCLVSAQRFAPYYAQAFRQPVERFEARFGIPRTDLFFDAPRIAAASAAIRARYRIPEGRRVVLYAPTFRGERITEARSPDALDLAELRRRIGDDHVVLVRAHPFVRTPVGLGPELEGFAIDVSGHPEINELMLVSDVLVTDYSSAIYEYSLLGRPMAFLAPDHAAYEAERGFYFDLASGLPGPILETTADLADHLRAGAFDLDRIARFRDASFDVADGQATRRVVDELLVPALGGGRARAER